MSQTRNQEYQYQYKMISISPAIFAGPGPTLFPYVPDDLLELKGLFCRLRLQFDASTDPSKRIIHSLGGVVFNAAADVNRIADISYDFSHVLSNFPVLGSGLTQPYFEIPLITNPKYSQTLLTGDVSGKIILWKTEWIYTTKGIQ